MKAKRIIILLIVVSILSMSFCVKATTGDKYDIALTADSTTLKAGDTVTLSLKVDNINIQSGEKGIGAYEGTIIYDSNIFEGIKMNSNEDWDTPTLNEGRFTSVRSDGLCTSQTQEIASITLKVKDNATSVNTKIQIKDFEASNGEENISTENKEITLKIEAKQAPNEDNKGNTTDKDTNNGNNTKLDVDNKNTTINKNTSTQNKLPYTGVSETLGIFIIILITAGIFSYIKYKRTY